MKNTERLIKKELEILDDIAKKVKERIRNAPDGTLRISNKRSGVEYYYKEKGGSGNGNYIRKKDKDLARKLAQRDYDKNLLRVLDNRTKLLLDFLEQYNKLDLGNIYFGENEYRKKLICDAILSNEQYVTMWQEVKYVGKPFLEGAPEIITEKGERVRSKSEKIIADKLYLKGIPYRYEYPLLLDGGLVIYPDFTILDSNTREEVYLEHFGMMDDKEYIDNFNLKISTYERNGIYLGINLFFTHETSKLPLNSRVLDGMLDAMF